MSGQLALKHQRTDLGICLNYECPKGAGWTERKAEGPLAARISHVHVKHLHQSVRRNCRGPGWAALNFEELKSGWSEFTPHQGSSQSKESTQKFQELLERKYFSPPSESPTPLLYYVTSAVASIKNTVVFWKLMKLLTLLIILPPLDGRTDMWEGRVSTTELSLLVLTKEKEIIYKWPKHNGVFWFRRSAKNLLHNFSMKCTSLLNRRRPCYVCCLVVSISV